MQGSKLKAKRVIRIVSLCKDAAPEFLHPLEFELRMYLTLLDGGGARLWELQPV